MTEWVIYSYKPIAAQLWLRKKMTYCLRSMKGQESKYSVPLLCWCLQYMLSLGHVSGHSVLNHASLYVVMHYQLH